MTTAIQTTNLCKQYGSKTVVKNLSLTILTGEVFGFLGPNGAGKSTTVKMLLGLVTPTAGEVSLLGQSPTLPAARARVGFLPEHFRFHEWLTAGEFLSLHGKLYNLPRATLQKRIPELLETVGLAESANLRLSGFSKGMLQRIGLAQAMLNKPSLIFLDEPTSGLDPLGRRLVRDIIHRLKMEGTTIFLNSHLLSEVEITCDRVAFIKKGEFIRTDTMTTLMAQDTQVTVRVDALSPPLLTELSALGTGITVNGSTLTMMVNSPDKVPQIARIILQHGAALFELHPRQKSLEEIFVDIIGTDVRES